MSENGSRSRALVVMLFDRESFRDYLREIPKSTRFELVKERNALDYVWLSFADSVGRVDVLVDLPFRLVRKMLGKRLVFRYREGQQRKAA